MSVYSSGWDTYGFTCTVQCDSHYAYMFPQEYEYHCDGELKGMQDVQQLVLSIIDWDEQLLRVKTVSVGGSKYWIQPNYHQAKLYLAIFLI